MKLRTLGAKLRPSSRAKVRQPPKVADAFYLSAEWRALMAAIIAERGRICEDRDCDGRTHRPGMRVFGDHIVERKDGGAELDPRNIMLRCGASHTRKTAAARARRYHQP